jgi:hypothetical protein
MSIKAGSILHVGGRNVIDRLQSAGVTGAVPLETIREIGNDLVVDHVPGEPDYTFSMEVLDVSTDNMAFLHGKVGTQVATVPPGSTDPAGTEYRWEDCQFVNILSPWKDDTGNAGGHIGAGMILPGYYPTRVRYSFGVAANASQTVDVRGGSYYYAQDAAPVEEVAAGDGVTAAYATAESAKAFRIGGAGGTTFKRVVGVLVNGVLQTEGTDYVQSIVAADVGQAAVTTVTFQAGHIPANLAQVKLCYFTTTAKTYPQAVAADTIIKPAAVRGRNIVFLVGTRGTDQVRLPGLQTFELDATVAGEQDREMGNADPVGFDNQGTDATGTATVRPKDRRAFFDALSRVTGVASDEVFGFFNEHEVPVEIQIQDPKNPGTILKTIYLPRGKFQPPGTPARVNAATDFPFGFTSGDGSFSEFKGARP